MKNPELKNSKKETLQKFYNELNPELKNAGLFTIPAERSEEFLSEIEDRESEEKTKFVKTLNELLKQPAGKTRITKIREVLHDFDFLGNLTDFLANADKSELQKKNINSNDFSKLLNDLQKESGFVILTTDQIFAQNDDVAAITDKLKKEHGANVSITELINVTQEMVADGALGRLDIQIKNFAEDHYLERITFNPLVFFKNLHQKQNIAIDQFPGLNFEMKKPVISKKDTPFNRTFSEKKNYLAHEWIDLLFYVEKYEEFPERKKEFLSALFQIMVVNGAIWFPIKNILSQKYFYPIWNDFVEFLKQSELGEDFLSGETKMKQYFLDFWGTKKNPDPNPKNIPFSGALKNLFETWQKKNQEKEMPTAPEKMKKTTKKKVKKIVQFPTTEKEKTAEKKFEISVSKLGDFQFQIEKLENHGSPIFVLLKNPPEKLKLNAKNKRLKNCWNHQKNILDLKNLCPPHPNSIKFFIGDPNSPHAKTKKFDLTWPKKKSVPAAEAKNPPGTFHAEPAHEADTSSKKVDKALQQAVEKEKQENMALLILENKSGAEKCFQLAETTGTFSPEKLENPNGLKLPAEIFKFKLEPFEITKPEIFSDDLEKILAEIVADLIQKQNEKKSADETAAAEKTNNDAEKKEAAERTEIFEKIKKLRRKFTGKSARFQMRENEMKKQNQNPYSAWPRIKSAEGETCFQNIQKIVKKLGIEISVQDDSCGMGNIAIQLDFGNDVTTIISVQKTDAGTFRINTETSENAKNFMPQIIESGKMLFRAIVIKLEKETLPENNGVRKNVETAEKKYVRKLEKSTKELAKSLWDHLSEKTGRAVGSRDENDLVDCVLKNISHETAQNKELILKNPLLKFPSKSKFKKIKNTTDTELISKLREQLIAGEISEKNIQNILKKNKTIKKETPIPMNKKQKTNFEKVKKFIGNKRNQKYLIGRIREVEKAKFFDKKSNDSLFLNEVLLDILNDIFPRIGESQESLCDARRNGKFLDKKIQDGWNKNWIDFFVEECAREGIVPEPESALTITYEELKVMAFNLDWKFPEEK
ncbi:hypothetical protein HN954_03060 [bacterium]|jgi:hypothetical protein|nr:hypothetical protein [bacterium]MBT6832170.1 hypothetical protein [bacterium]MBT6996384.1 hypothetical protein [bacterium]MBT7772119.1 hypothetical protein [bacterium]